MTTFEIVRDLVLLILGATGAALSIFNFVDIRRRTARKLEIASTAKILNFDDGLGGRMLCVTAINVGQRNVTVTNLGLEFPGNRTLALIKPYAYFPEPELPKTLADGEIVERHFAYYDITHALRSMDVQSKANILPFAVDSSGDRHFGKPLSFDVNEFRK